MRDLHDAKIINYDSNSNVIIPLNEADIMTKHVIKFKTMAALMQISCDSSIDKVIIRCYYILNKILCFVIDVILYICVCICMFMCV